MQRWRGKRRIGHARWQIAISFYSPFSTQQRKDEESQHQHLLSQSFTPLSFSHSQFVQTLVPLHLGLQYKACRSATSQLLPSVPTSCPPPPVSIFFFFFTIFFPPLLTSPLCRIHLYQAKAGAVPACLPARLTREMSASSVLRLSGGTPSLLSTTLSF